MLGEGDVVGAEVVGTVEVECLRRLEKVWAPCEMDVAAVGALHQPGQRANDEAAALCGHVRGAVARAHGPHSRRCVPCVPGGGRCVSVLAVAPPAWFTPPNSDLTISAATPFSHGVVHA